MTSTIQGLISTIETDWMIKNKRNSKGRKILKTWRNIEETPFH
jgi:hypothetical protein